MTWSHLRLPVLLAAALAGCGSSSGTSDAGGDAGPPPVDADTDRDGDEPVPDAAPDDAEAPSDAGADGGAPPDAGAPCEEVGATRTAECGACGMVAERCNDELVWERTSACLGEKECVAGTSEARSTPMCGEEQRLCSESCEWGSWERTEPDDGDCTMGETRLSPDGCSGDLVRTETCSESCTWEPTGDCHNGCGDATWRMTPWDAEEICIPAGTFIRGMNGSWITEPEREVYVSSYYIDRYPVTNRRYRECTDAGVCTGPTLPQGRDSFADPTRDAYPVQDLTWHQARDFCEWDARRLPTEAEWEKAGRGPAPRDDFYPWSGSSWRCDLIYGEHCGWSPPLDERGTLPDPVDAYPAAASSYGVELMLGGAYEHVQDWFDTDYYADAASTDDPQGPPSGTAKVRRGIPRENTNEYTRLISRFSREPDLASERTSVRCARSVE